MNVDRESAPRLFEGFAKAAQYIVRLKSQQDVWDHLARLIISYFPADWAAFARRDAVGGISLHHGTPLEKVDAQRVLAEEGRSLVAEVLDSGFLASGVIAVAVPSMTAFLPIVEEYQVKEVMLIGHQGTDPLPKELLEVYLAVAGLAGTAFERLHSEQELNRHREHLEELVKERTAELAKAKRHNELILDSVREGICGLDLEGRITFVNLSAAKTLGWEPAELVGRNSHLTFHHMRPDGCPYPVEECAVHSALTQGDARDVANETFVRKDGSQFPVEFQTAPIVEDGKTVGAVMVFQNVTERRQLELEQQKFVSLADNSTEFIGMCDMNFMPFYVNESGRRLVGLGDLARACQAPVKDFFFPEDQKFIYEDFFPRVLQHGRAEVEIRFRHFETGAAIWMIYNVFFIRDARGNPIGLATVSRNITDRKRAEEALRQTAEDLARSNSDLEQFAYVASHDLQEPLRAVSGFVQILQQQYASRLDAKADEYITFAVDGAKRMQTLIGDLLAYSRVGTRGQEPMPTDMGAVLQQALDNVGASIQETGAVITHGQLPTVPADGRQFTQIFQNLIGNALKFRGADPPKIHVDACRNKDHWEFSVRDNGIGIAPEFQDRIFLIFQRLHTRARYPGTGIGLAICKKIVERHGGRIWVESQSGQGATFHFTLPT